MMLLPRSGEDLEDSRGYQEDRMGARPAKVQHSQNTRRTERKGPKSSPSRERDPGPERGREMTTRDGYMEPSRDDGGDTTVQDGMKG